MAVSACGVVPMRGRFRSARIGRGRRRRRGDDDATETDTEEDEVHIPEDDDEEDGVDPNGDEEDEEGYVVRCQGCGIKYDDGQAMIECEMCKVWAHIDCLKKQMATDPVTFQFDFEHYVCFGCQRKHAGAGLPPLGLPGLPPLSTALGLPPGVAEAGLGVGWGMDRNGGHSGLPAHTRLGAGMASGFAAAAGGDGRAGKDDLGTLLLGLANGLGAGAGTAPVANGGAKDVDGWQCGRRSSGRLARARSGNHGEDLLQPWGPLSRPSSALRPHGSLPVSEDVFDSLTHFLTNRSGSVLGHRAPSPKPPGSPVVVGKQGTSGPLPAPRAQCTHSHQGSMEELLAASQGQAGAASAAAALLSARSGSLGDGRHSPVLMSALRRAGSSQPLTLPPLQFGGAGAPGMVRPASRGPLGEYLEAGGHSMFADMGDETHNGPLTQMALDALRGDNALLSILGARAPTPSQLFIDSLLRGATPDINIAPLVAGGVGGAAAGAATAGVVAATPTLAHAAAAVAHIPGLSPAPLPTPGGGGGAAGAAAGAAAADATAAAAAPPHANGLGASGAAAPVAGGTGGGEVGCLRARWGLVLWWMGWGGVLQIHTRQSALAAWPATGPRGRWDWHQGWVRLVLGYGLGMGLLGFGRLRYPTCRMADGAWHMPGTPSWVPCVASRALV